MLQYSKKSELKRLLSKVVTNDCIIRGIFEDNPDLECFSFEKTSEYDDNNYSDQVVLTSINNHHVDFDGRYEDDDNYEGCESGKEKSELPKVSRDVVECIMDVIYDLSSDFDYDEHKVNRNSYVNKSFERLDKEEAKYLNSYLTKTKIEEKWFVKNVQWAAYYAEDNGPFSKEIEAKIFCKEGRMRDAYMYAQATKAPLSNAIETFFTTRHLVDPNDNDNFWLKKYLLFKNGLKKELVG